MKITNILPYPFYVSYPVRGRTLQPGRSLKVSIDLFSNPRFTRDVRSGAIAYELTAEERKILSGYVNNSGKGLDRLEVAKKKESVIVEEKTPIIEETLNAETVSDTPTDDADDVVDVAEVVDDVSDADDDVSSESEAPLSLADLSAHNEEVSKPKRRARAKKAVESPAAEETDKSASKRRSRGTPTLTEDTPKSTPDEIKAFMGSIV